MATCSESKQFTVCSNTTYAVMAADLRGVLVAISIPIFTAQLRKARLATNQANARAAKAAIVAEILDAGTDTAAVRNAYSGKDDIVTYTYTYTVSTAKAATSTTAATDTKNVDPAKWDVDTKINDKAMGDKVAISWTYTIDSTGDIKGIACAYE